MVAKIHVRRNKRLELAGALMGPKQVKAGFPAGKADSDIVDRAIWNHYGTRGSGWGGPIPARPFVLNAIRKNKRKYLNALKTSASKLVRGETTLPVVMRKLGIVAQGDIQDEITSLRNPPNSPVTIAMKGSSNPLIDSGEMRGAVIYEVTS